VGFTPLPEFLQEIRVLSHVQVMLFQLLKQNS
jgi:hypothetical protein